MIQSRPRRYDQVFISRTFISFIFFYPKQANKCFTVGHRTRNSLETQKLSTRRNYDYISNLLEVQSLLKCIEDRLLLSHLGI